MIYMAVGHWPWPGDASWGGLLRPDVAEQAKHRTDPRTPDNQLPRRRCRDGGRRWTRKRFAGSARGDAAAACAGEAERFVRWTLPAGDGEKLPARPADKAASVGPSIHLAATAGATPFTVPGSAWSSGGRRPWSGQHWREIRRDILNHIASRTSNSRRVLEGGSPASRAYRGQRPGSWRSCSPAMAEDEVLVDPGPRHLAKAGAPGNDRGAIPPRLDDAWSTLGDDFVQLFPDLHRCRRRIRQNA